MRAASVFALGRRHLFPIGAQQMCRVMRRHEAELARGRPRLVHHEPRGDAAALVRQHLLQALAVSIVADDADEQRIRAEACDVARDIARTADHHVLVADANDRRRRFGRDPRHVAVDERIEHQVADAEHRLPADLVEPFFEIEHAPVLAVGVGSVEELRHVAFDALFDRGEARVVARAAQVIDLRLGEILILPADAFRHVDVFDRGLTP